MNRYDRIASRLVQAVSDVWLSGVKRDIETIFGGGNWVSWEYESYLTFTEGTSNKFHYFAVVRVKQPDGSDVYVGGNAYGRIGGTAKVIEIARGSRMAVKSVVDRKEGEKVNKGYRYS